MADHAFVIKTTEADGREYHFHTVQTTEARAERAFRKIHRHWKRPLTVARLFPSTKQEKKGDEK